MQVNADLRKPALARARDLPWVSPPHAHELGEEIPVVDGAARSAEFGELGTLIWFRNPSAGGAPIRSPGGAVLWVRRAHLAPDAGH